MHGINTDTWHCRIWGTLHMALEYGHLEASLGSSLAPCRYEWMEKTLLHWVLENGHPGVAWVLFKHASGFRCDYPK